MGKIQILDEQLTNLIAAGEVVERISSVVKELVENSIDAGATKIKISLIDAGLSEIRVTDNGSGMDARDAKLSVLPHSTSKIKSRDDLFSIRTLGFRGEALASIASVSNFKIITSVDGYHGIMVTWRGGKLVTEATVSRPRGTDIIVKNLFFNTPVRLQSLQSENIELGYVIDYVSKMALARPDISFELLNNDKILVNTFGSNDCLEAIYSIYGANVAKNMVSIYDDNGLYKIEGFISKIQETRSSKNNIVLTINGRVIRNNSIINAIVAGYSNKLMIGRYPIALINIKVDPSMVDVNVHPSKLEVRFSGEDKLKEMITNVIDKTLKETDLSVEIGGDSFYSKYSLEDKEGINNKNNIASSIDNYSLYEEVDNKNEELKQDLSDESTQKEDDIPFEYDSLFDGEDEEITDLLENDRELNAGNIKDLSEIEDDSEDYIDEETHKNLYLNEDISKFETLIPENNENVKYEQMTLDEEFKFEKRDGESLNTAQRLPKLTFVGQLFGTYILAVDDNTMYLIDQHAAMERINYEKIKKELSNSHSLTYDLLVPFSIEFSPQDCYLIEEKMEEIQRLGICLEEFGNNTYIVRTIPTWIFRGKEKEFVEEIITKIISSTQNRNYDKAYFLDSLAKSLACKKSIKGNEFHSKMEIEYLLDELSHTLNPYTCPHGRPVIVRITNEEIEKWFKRIV